MTPFQRSRGYATEFSKPGTPTDALPVNPARLRAEPHRVGDPFSAEPALGESLTYEPLRYGDLYYQPLLIGSLSERVLARPQTRRTFLLIVNTSVNILYVGFGTDATAMGLPLNAAAAANTGGGAVLFDAWVPQNEIYVFGSAAVTTGVLYWNEI